MDIFLEGLYYHYFLADTYTDAVNKLVGYEIRTFSEVVLIKLRRRLRDFKKSIKDRNLRKIKKNEISPIIEECERNLEPLKEV